MDTSLYGCGNLSFGQETENRNKEITVYGKNITGISRIQKEINKAPEVQNAAVFCRRSRYAAASWQPFIMRQKRFVKRQANSTPHLTKDWTIFVTLLQWLFHPRPFDI